MKSAILTGHTHEHVQPWEGSVLVHHKVMEPLLRLKKKAEKDGISIKVASGFRDFEAQLKIWNAKCLGMRPVLDARGEPIDIAGLDPDDLIHAILRWSALPGASRHHWGTDIDIFDAAACPKDYRVQLVPQEAEAGGPFHVFSTWLEKHLREEGFFRPYARDLGGVSPEWWHVSYEPLATAYFEGLTLDKLEVALAFTDMQLKTEVLRLLPEIYSRYVRKICAP